MHHLLQTESLTSVHGRCFGSSEIRVVWQCMAVCETMQVHQASDLSGNESGFTGHAVANQSSSSKAGLCWVTTSIWIVFLTCMSAGNTRDCCLSIHGCIYGCIWFHRTKKKAIN